MFPAGFAAPEGKKQVCRSANRNFIFYDYIILKLAFQLNCAFSTVFDLKNGYVAFYSPFYVV